MGHQGEMNVPFRPAGLWSLTVLGAVLIGGGIGMMLLSYEAFGLVVPRLMSVVAGCLGVLLGSWMLFATVRRWVAPDPAMRTVPGRLLLHVNPGRRRSLNRVQVRRVEGPVPSHGIQRWILGPAVLRIKTTQPERLMASDVLVGQAMVDVPLEAVARDLRTWLDTDE